MAAATSLRGTDCRPSLRGPSYPQPGGAGNSENLRPLRSRRGKCSLWRAARTSGMRWSRGMSAGGGTSASSGQSARHVSVLLTRSDATARAQNGGVYVDATFGAGGYSRAILERRRYAGDRHRSRSHGDHRGLRPGRSRGRTAGAGRRPIRQSRRCLPRARPRRGRRRRHGYRRLVDATGSGRTRLLVPSRRAARHAHGRRRAERGGRDRSGSARRPRAHHHRSRRRKIRTSDRARDR